MLGTTDPRPLIGEPLGIDLLNTVWRDAEGTHDLLDGPNATARWLAGHALDGPADACARAALVETREALRTFLADPDSGATRAAVNALLRRGAERPLLTDIALTTQTEASPAWRAPWRAARELVALHAQQPERIRRCANPDCPLYFLDTSRPGTRRWCSMNFCGNRHKARRHYQRTRTP